MLDKKYTRLEKAIKKSEEKALQNEKEYRRYLNGEEHFPSSLGTTPSASHNSIRIGEVLSTGGSSSRPKDPRDKFEKQRPPGVPFIPPINKPPRPARGPRPTDSEKTEDGRIIVRDSSDPELLYRALDVLRDFHGRWKKKNPGNNNFMEFVGAYNNPGEGQKTRLYFYAGSITSFETFQVKYRAANNAANAQKRARAIKTNQIV